MPAAYTLERFEPSVTRCDCCGALRVRLTRFVYENDKIVAYYYVAYGQSHDAEEIERMVSLGPWDEDSGEAFDQAAFFAPSVRSSAGTEGAVTRDACGWMPSRPLGVRRGRSTPGAVRPE